MSVPEPLQQIDRTYVRFERRKLSYFAGCDYYRMTSHPAVREALDEGLDRYGLSVAASRMTTGNHTLFGKLEADAAAFFGFGSALLVSTGYLTNAIAAQGLKGEFSHALIDEKAHPSLQDASQFLGCPVLKFKHRNPDDLEKALRRIGKVSKPILLTDGMFSGSGELAPLKAYLERLPRDAVILVDDAHGAGILGKTGKGTPEEEGVGNDRIIQTITLSKAFGVYGGVILCPSALREQFITRSHMFAGCTPLPLPLVNAARKTIRILKRDRSYLRRLRGNVEYAKDILRKKNIPIAATPAPILPIIPESASAVAAIRKRLLKNQVFPSFIRYPGGPENGYFRFVLSSEHSKDQLDALLTAL